MPWHPWSARRITLKDKRGKKKLFLLIDAEYNLLYLWISYQIQFLFGSVNWLNTETNNVLLNQLEQLQNVFIIRRIFVINTTMLLYPAKWLTNKIGRIWQWRLKSSCHTLKMRLKNVLNLRLYLVILGVYWIYNRLWATIERNWMNKF